LFTVAIYLFTFVVYLSFGILGLSVGGCCLLHFLNTSSYVPHISSYFAHIFSYFLHIPYHCIIYSSILTQESPCNYISNSCIYPSRVRMTKNDIAGPLKEDEYTLQTFPGEATFHHKIRKVVNRAVHTKTKILRRWSPRHYFRV